MRGIRSWLAYLLARLITAAMFRSVEVFGEADHDGPRLIVANHLAGFVDVIVLVHALHGLPHFVAKSTLFRRLPMRLFLRFFGVIPVYRRRDQSDMTKNRSSFEEVEAVLAKGRTVLIFPEGTATDEQRLLPVRTGAARMTLGAMSEGVRHLAIVPMGITYEDKGSSRSRVLVDVSESIDADAELTPLVGDSALGEENRPLVHATTELIRDRLAAVSPDFGSLLRERMMMLAASIHLRTELTNPFSSPRMSEMRDVAQRLGHLTAAEGQSGFDDLLAYQFALAAAGLDDDQIMPKPHLGDMARLALKKALIVLLLAPLALFGFVANILPLLITIAIGWLIREPVTKGTAQVIAALVLFPLSWVLWIILISADRKGLVFLLLLIGSVFLVLLIEQLLGLIEAALGWWSVRSRVALLPDLFTERSKAEAELVAAMPGSD